MKDVQALPETDTDYGHKLLISKICTRFKKIIRFQKWKSGWDLEKLYAQSQKVQIIYKKNLLQRNVKLECESAVIKKCLLNTVSDLVGNSNRRARKQRLIIQKNLKQCYKNAYVKILFIP